MENRDISTVKAKMGGLSKKINGNLLPLTTHQKRRKDHAACQIKKFPLR